MTTFEELACYREARALRQMVAAFCKTLPGEEKYRLKDQVVRASRSVTANIAEGYGRHHHQENMQFCRQARGSLSETLDHLNVAIDEQYLSADAGIPLRMQVEKTWKILNGYLAYLSKCATTGVPGSALAAK